MTALPTELIECDYVTWTKILEALFVECFSQANIPKEFSKQLEATEPLLLFFNFVLQRLSLACLSCQHKVFSSRMEFLRIHLRVLPMPSISWRECLKSEFTEFSTKQTSPPTPLKKKNPDVVSKEVDLEGQCKRLTRVLSRRPILQI